VESGEAVTTSPEPAASAAAKSQLASRVLLVEDGPDNQRLITFFLTKAGAEVTLAENGEQAVQFALAARAENRSYDVVLMDMQMPIMDGYAATRHLREQGYDGPIIALTANAMTGDREKCLAAGCTDFTSKPVNRDKLLQLVSRYSTAPVARA
jgi:CheY-like chemotaxis protein